MLLCGLSSICFASDITNNAIHCNGDLPDFFLNLCRKMTLGYILGIRIKPHIFMLTEIIMQLDEECLEYLIHPVLPSDNFGLASHIRGH